MTQFRSVPLDARAARSLALWRELEEDSATSSYFLSTGFIETWLSCLPQAVTPELVCLFEGDRPAAAFFLGKRQLARHGFLSSRARFLNTTGVERYDELCVEHNAPLVRRGASVGMGDIARAIPGDWDELFLPGLDEEEAAAAVAGGTSPYVLRVDRSVSAPFVDLAKVRSARYDYPSLLSANTRAQVKRARRAFGAIEVEVAATELRAFEIYGELTRLHQTHWRRLGESGAFADPWFDAFHRRLIARRFSSGEIQLARVSSGGETIGCLYNLVSRGRVLFYQSGLVPFDNPQRKSGYVCHAALVEHNARAGHDVYDFLGGNGRYKRSLATGATELVWARIQRPLARFTFEERVRGWMRAVRSSTASRSQVARPAPSSVV